MQLRLVSSLLFVLSAACVLPPPACSHPSSGPAGPAGPWSGAGPCEAPLQWEGRSVQYDHGTGRNTRSDLAYDAFLLVVRKERGHHS